MNILDVCLLYLKPKHWKKKLIKKTSKKNKIAFSYEGLISSLFPWVLALLWVGLTPPATSAFQGKKRSFTTLKYTNALIKIFKKKYGVVPPSLTHLRAFSASFNRSLTTYDGFGQPIDYIWLSDNEYIIRSFGKDGEQNTIVSERDLSYAYVKNRNQEGLLFDGNSSLGSYPYLLLDGYVSPNKLWHAKVYINSRNGTKRLILRNLKEKSIIMVASHERVEQFFWLSDGFRIIYTAINPISQKTEVYLWNILNDRSTRFESANVDSITSADQENSDEHIELLNVDKSSKYLTYRHYDFKSGVNSVKKVELEEPALSKSMIISSKLEATSLDWVNGLKTLPKTNKDISTLINILPSIESEDTLRVIEESTNQLSDSAVYPYLLANLAEKYRVFMTRTPDPAKSEVAKRSIDEINKVMASTSLFPPHLVFKAHQQLSAQASNSQ